MIVAGLHGVRLFGRHGDGGDECPIKGVSFIDRNPTVFDAARQVRGELFRPDSLYYLPPTYDRFTAVMKPALEEAEAIR